MDIMGPTTYFLGLSLKLDSFIEIKSEVRIFKIGSVGSTAANKCHSNFLVIVYNVMHHF